ncbi:MAG: hypothetical protein ACOC2Z_04860, partial [Coleofasciculus sp.]
MFGWAFVGLAISGGFTSDLAFQAQDYDSIPVSEAANRAEDASRGGEVCTEAPCYVWEAEDEELIDYSDLSPDVEHLSPTRKEALIFPPSQTLLTDTSNVTVSESMNPVSDEREQFQQIMDWVIAQHLHQQPMTDIIQAIAQRFVGTPYKAGLLDQSPDETLVVTLQAFDCVLFVET